ncbi:MAG: tyrosine-protein kinase [Acidimicrobiaceae bacterium]|nr:tyrosine-protein kinase [Acidimicrobiaceae bacterium]
MELRQYLDILKRHRWFLVEAVVLVALAAGILSAVRTPVYQGTARVLLRPNDPTEQLDPSQAARQQNGDPNRYVTAQKDIAESEAVARAAAKSLNGLPFKQVMRSSSAHQRGASDVLEITGKDVDPARARDIADEVARSYIENRRLSAVAGLEKATQDIETRLTDLQLKIADLDAKIGTSPGTTSSLQPPPPAATAPSNPTTPPDGTGLRDGSQPTTKASLEAARYAAAVQYESLFARQQDLLVEKNLKRGEAEMISLAETPTSPISPKPLRDGILGAFVGLLLGVGITFLREQLDDRIRSRAEVERITGLPILAEVPYDDEVAKSPSQVAVLERPQGPLSEAMRALRTSVHFVAVDEPVKVLIVTSAGPAEGKSLVAANLAAVYAQAGYRTLLVSADLRRPRLDTLFPASKDSIGLTGVIAELSRNGKAPGSAQAHLAGALVQTRVPNLTLLPAGARPPNPAELLNSRRMGEVLTAVADVADVVIIDTPPLLAVTDAAVLAARADGVVLVAALGETHRDAAQRARAILTSTNARVLGVVVNKSGAGRSGYYAGYYGYYATEPEDAKGKRKGRRRDRTQPQPAPGVTLSADDFPVEPAGFRRQHARQAQQTQQAQQGQQGQPVSAGSSASVDAPTGATPMADAAKPGPSLLSGLRGWLHDEAHEESDR